MSTLTLALVMIVVVVAVLIATRPAPREARRSARPVGADKKSRDPLSASRLELSKPDLGPALVLAGVDRNRWDRPDLATGVGRDDQAWEPALLLWPKQPRSLASVA